MHLRSRTLSSKASKSQRKELRVSVIARNGRDIKIYALEVQQTHLSNDSKMTYDDDTEVFKLIVMVYINYDKEKAFVDNTSSPAILSQVSGNLITSELR